ncbi:MAG TPA: amidohydrolase family protein [Polyangia bacterium]
MQTSGSSILRSCAIAVFGLGSLLACATQKPATSPASLSETGPIEGDQGTPNSNDTKADPVMEPVTDPIMDTHIHLYQVTKPGGVPWPPPAAKNLYRDILPAEYKEVAKRHGIVATGIVEANPTLEENLRVLELVKGDDFFKFFVPSLELGSPSFAANLETLAKDPRVVGVRGFLWSPKLTVDAKQVASAELLAKKGMTLDIISRGDLNPKDKVDALAAAVPNLRIIIDHLAGAKGEKPDPKWVAAVQKLAKRPNIYIKFSSFFDMFNPAGSEDNPWKSPSSLSAYKPHFDVLMKAFGEDRLIWGSNWPVVGQGGDIGQSIALAEEYLKAFGPEVRDKVMYRNAQSFYQRR